MMLRAWGPMRVTTIRPDELSQAELDCWRGFLDSAPELASPYLQPEFTRLVGEARRGVRVAVMEDAGAIVGFLPFQRGWGGVGKPVGAPLSDFHAVIARPDYPWDADSLVAGCGLARFDFTDLPATQPQFGRHRRRSASTFVIDIAGGYDAYAAERRASGSHVLKKTGAAARRIERELGAVRFVAHDSSPIALARLIEWKRDQYRRTKATDVFAHSWTIKLLETIRDAQQPGFSGQLSTLYAGDELIAAHMGMRSRTMLHYWFPAHATAAQRYSPGLVLLKHLVQAAPRQGTQVIDLGRGDYPYKRRFATREVTLAQGSVVRPSLSALAYRARIGIETAAHGLPLGRASHWPEKLFRRLDMKASLREWPRSSAFALAWIGTDERVAETLGFAATVA